MKAMKALVVVPCFNEASRFNPQYWAEMDSFEYIDWLFVDDGSTDKTREIIELYLRSSSTGRSSLLSLDKNVGKGEAIRAGWIHSGKNGYDSLGFIDADGAFNKTDLEQVLDAYHTQVEVGEFEAIWTSRVALAGRSIERNSSRHYIGRIVATVLSWGGHQIPYDTQCGLKFFKNGNDFERVIQQSFETRWLFEMEILIKYQQIEGSPLKVWEVPLDFWNDVPGSKITRKESFRILGELLKIKRLQKVK
jgi:glycosyltransferase involved in cell wall biosynthesis